MAWWPWNARSQISVRDVPPLSHDELQLAEQLVNWAARNFEPRQRPVQRWRDLTRWDRHGAKDAQQSLELVRNLITEQQRVVEARKEQQQRLDHLRTLSSTGDLGELGEVATEVQGRIRALEADREKLHRELDSAHELKEEVLTPLRERRDQLRKELNSHKRNARRLREKTEQLQQERDELVDGIGQRERASRKLQGVLRGLR